MKREEFIAKFEAETGKNTPKYCDYENYGGYQQALDGYNDAFTNWLIAKLTKKDAEIERLENEYRVAQYNVTLQMDCRAKSERKLQSLKAKMEKTQKETMWKYGDTIMFQNPGYPDTKRIQVALMEVEEK